MVEAKQDHQKVSCQRCALGPFIELIDGSIKCVKCDTIQLCSYCNVFLDYKNFATLRTAHKKCAACIGCNISPSNFGEANWINWYGKYKHQTCIEIPCVVCDKMIGPSKYRRIYGKFIHKTCIIKTKCFCGKKAYNLQEWWPNIWMPLSHKKFPKEFRKIVYTLLLVRKFGTFNVSNDIFAKIINLIKIPLDFKIQNGITINNICLNTRCALEMCLKI
jgi:hypothetical protein